MTEKHRQAGRSTRIAHGGRSKTAQFGAVNPPVVRASTILFDSYEAFVNRKSRDRRKGEYMYGRSGLPGSVALEGLVAELEGAADCVTVSSGAAAVVAPLMVLLNSGEHLLVADTVYEPTRAFCVNHARRLGIEIEFYDPRLGAGIAALCRPNTRGILLESPGSLTFEVQDLPAIAAVAQARDIYTVIDNTWASPLGLQPLKFGIDVSVHAGTKHIVGHSDAMLGLICSNARVEKAMRAGILALGHNAGTEEIFLGLRGLRTMELRLRQSAAAGLAVAQWLAGRPEVARVLFPPLPSDPGHALWQRDFTGACGLFGVVLARPYAPAAVAAMLDGYDWFGIGASWGGFESLVIPTFPERLRTAVPWSAPGPTLRYAIGLEDPADLIDDLARGFERLEAAAAAAA